MNATNSLGTVLAVSLSVAEVDALMTVREDLIHLEAETMEMTPLHSLLVKLYMALPMSVTRT